MIPHFEKHLYHVLDHKIGVGQATFKLKLDRHHRIYEGHFAGAPITPGVCTVQIIEELAVSAWQAPPRLFKLDNVKFLKFIDPRKDSIINCTMKWSDNNNSRRLLATIQTESTAFVKYRATFHAE